MIGTPNSELELLRQTPPEDQDHLDALVSTWKARGERYSMKRAAGQQSGWQAVGIIVKFIDGTPVGTKGDWKDLAGLLGLDILSINVSCIT